MLLDVGRITKAHGLRGEVIVDLTTDRVERVQPGAVLHTGDRALVVVASRPHQDRWLVTFEGVIDRAGADALAGRSLQAEPIDGDDDTIWIHDLIGATVVEVNGTARGTVESVLDNPAHDLLVLDSGALVPMPFVVSVADGVVTIDPPDGLFD